jgi:hypothetical protein
MYLLGLLSSQTIVCILSREGINHPTASRQNFGTLHADSPLDSVLLEHVLALELRELGLIEKIFPLMIGDKEDSNHGLFFETGCLPQPPSVIVDSVEKDLYRTMEAMSLGTPVVENRTVAQTLSSITSCQGSKIEGHRETAFSSAVDSIVGML